MKIAICGESNTGGSVNVGKDTFAKIFREEYYNVTRNVVDLNKNNNIEFARPLKEICATLLNVPIEMFYDRRFKEEYRPFLIQTSKALKTIGENVILLPTVLKVKNITSGLIIFTDLRLVNEVEYVKREQIPIVKIKRNAVRVNDDVTETFSSNIEADYVYDNNGTLEDMRNYIKELIQTLINK
jgi:hypothetical protein